MFAALTHTHSLLGARSTAVNGVSLVGDYGNERAEYDWLRQSVGIVDLSLRGRLCVTGADRRRFLHGQVTNDINKLNVGQGTYAAITNAKGKMVADANIYPLADEYLLDLEPGVTPAVLSRLEKYIIADDVEILNVGDRYGLIAVIGVRAPQLLTNLQLGIALPGDELQFTQTQDRPGGDVYCMRHSHGAAAGFDVFIPVEHLSALFSQLLEEAGKLGGGPVGWNALETIRIEAGIPRFRQDMDETNLASETGIEARAISYSKGCYIGQEVIARIRTYGQVAKALRGLQFAADGPVPSPHDALFVGERDVGYVTSSVTSPSFGPIGLGYVRREHNEIGAELTVRTGHGNVPARIVALPFQPPA